jgi:hypothetical protein
LPPLPAPADNAAMEAEQPKTAPPILRRRWYQFSLRTVLIFTVVVAVACALVGRRIERKRRERGTIEAITGAGGTVVFDYQLANRNVVPLGPAWLRSLFGEQFFSEVVEIKSARADLRHLDEMPRLTTLLLSGQSIHDDDLAQIHDLPQLVSLSLAGTPVTDAGIARLHRLPKLTVLTLMDTKITDRALATIKRLGQLTNLSLTNTAVTDDCTADLREMTRLRQLQLTWTSVSDSGLANLKRLLELQSLELEYVTDDGLKQLEQFVALRFLHIADADVTKTEVNRFKQALPNCQLFCTRHFPLHGSRADPQDALYPPP